jgi:hypothetical protein
MRVATKMGNSSFDFQTGEITEFSRRRAQCVYETIQNR